MMWSRWLLFRCGWLRASPEKLLFLPLFFDLFSALGIHLFHFFQLRRRQFLKASNEVHELPSILVVLVAGFTPGGHTRHANTVLDDRVQLAVGQPLRVIQSHIRRLRIKVAADRGVAASVIRVT